MNNIELEKIIIEEQYFTVEPQINEVIERFNEETHYYSKLHRLIDLIEVIIKTHAAFAISSYVEIGEFNPEIQKSLALQLSKPSLGHWYGLSKAIIEDLIIRKNLSKYEFKEMSKLITNKSQRDNFTNKYELVDDIYQLIQCSPKQKKSLMKCYEITKYKYSHNLHFDGYYEYFINWMDIINYKDEKNDLLDLISFRNYYAHGSTADEEKSKKEIIKYLPRVKTLLEKTWLNEVSLIVFKEKREDYIYVNQDNIINNFYNNNLDNNILLNKKIKLNTPYFLNSYGQLLECFPIIFFNKGIDNIENLLFFLNDCKKLKQERISLLNYPNSIHYVDEHNTNNFIARMDLLNWGKLKVDRFQERINALTENFYGRNEDLNLLRDFVKFNQRGFFLLSGKQGMGKSALIAKFIQELSVNMDDSNSIYYIEYFIRTNTLFSSPSFFLDYFCEKLKVILNISDVTQTNTLEEKQILLDDLLNIASKTLTNKKLVIIIDGLDEGVESGLTNYLINNYYNNILIIYSSRLEDQPKIKSLYYSISKLEKHELKLGPLRENDIKGILFNSLDKYFLIQNESIVNLIEERSKGEPLYLKLLIMALEDNQISLDSMDKIPDSINKWFKDNISRLLLKDLGNEAFQALIIFAVAKDNITKKQLELYLNNCNLNVNSGTVEKIINILSDWLQENDDNILSYQLFHNELRHYLTINYQEECKFAEKAIVDCCCNWDKYMYIGEGIYKYSLIFYIDHLISLDLFDEIENLIKNEDYINEQLKTIKDYYATFKMLEMAKEYFSAKIKLNIEKSHEMLIKVMLITMKVYNKMDIDKYKIIENIESYTLNEIYSIINQIKSFDKEKEIIYMIILDKIAKSENDETLLFNAIVDDIKCNDIYLEGVIPKEILLYIYLSLYKHKYSYKIDNIINSLSLISNFNFNLNKELIKMGIDKLFIRYINENKDKQIQNVIKKYCMSCIELGCIDEFSRFMQFIETEATGETFKDRQWGNTGKKFINGIYFKAFNILMKNNDFVNADVFIEKTNTLNHYYLADIASIYHNHGLTEKSIKYLDLFKKDLINSYNSGEFVHAEKLFKIMNFCEKMKLKEEEEFYFSFLMEHLKNIEDDEMYLVLLKYINNKNDDNYSKYLPEAKSVINLSYRDSLPSNDLEEEESILDTLPQIALIKFYLNRNKYNEVLKFLDLFSKKHREIEGVCLLYTYYFNENLDKKFLSELILKINKWGRREKSEEYQRLLYSAIKELLLHKPEINTEVINKFKVNDFIVNKYSIIGFIRNNDTISALKLFKKNDSNKFYETSEHEKIPPSELIDYYDIVFKELIFNSDIEQLNEFFDALPNKYKKIQVLSSIFHNKNYYEYSDKVISLIEKNRELCTNPKIIFYIGSFYCHIMNFEGSINRFTELYKYNNSYENYKIKLNNINKESLYINLKLRSINNDNNIIGIPEIEDCFDLIYVYMKDNKINDAINKWKTLRDITFTYESFMLSTKEMLYFDILDKLVEDPSKELLDLFENYGCNSKDEIHWINKFNIMFKCAYKLNKANQFIFEKKIINYIKSNLSKITSSTYKDLLKEMLDYYNFITKKNKNLRKFWNDYSDNLTLSFILDYLKYIDNEEAKLLCRKMEQILFPNCNGENIKLKPNFIIESDDSSILAIDSLYEDDAIELIKRNKQLNNEIMNYYSKVVMCFSIIDFKINSKDYIDAIRLINSFSDIEYRVIGGSKLLFHLLKNDEDLYANELLEIFNLSEDEYNHCESYLIFILKELTQYVTEKSLDDFLVILNEFNSTDSINPALIRVVSNTNKYIECLTNISLDRSQLKEALITFAYYLYYSDKDNKLLYEINNLFEFDDFKLEKNEEYIKLIDMVKLLGNKEISLESFKDYVSKL